ncbi:MAG: class I SAM-dependent methyltransferase [Oscillospiraceae bacterium]|nr:class I SAM-dependent methyltransferase [Oscillospiraceae bacterium]
MCKTENVSQWYEDKKNVQEMREWNPALKTWEREVIAHFPSSARLLDIGCGLGREAFHLADLGYDVVGLDISQEVISQVRQLSAEKGCDIPFIVYDGKKLPFPDDSFDVVLIWAQTFGLLYGEAFRRDYLAECGRVLKTGGLFSFSTHDCDYLKAQYPHCLDGRRFYPYAGSEIYWEAFERSELVQYARQAGFNVILCEKGSIYKPEDGTILHCLCRKPQVDKENQGGN